MQGPGRRLSPRRQRLAQLGGGDRERRMSDEPDAAGVPGGQQLRGQPGAQLGAPPPRSGEHDEPRQAEDVRPATPGVERRQRVAAEDQVQLGVGLLAAVALQGRLPSCRRLN